MSIHRLIIDFEVTKDEDFTGDNLDVSVLEAKLDDQEEKNKDNLELTEIFCTLLIDRKQKESEREFALRDA